MKKILFILFSLSFLIQFSIVHGNEENLSPKLYQNLWPDFCLDHVKNFPEACSEQHTNEQGKFYLDYFDHGSVECHIDHDILHRLSAYLRNVPPNAKRCDFRICQNCNTPVVRGTFLYDEEYEEDEEEDADELVIVCYRCKCLKDWHDEINSDDVSEREFIQQFWKRCINPSLPHDYFNIHSKQFIHFLEQHIKYIDENSECTCYWPYRSKEACFICDTVHKKMYSLLEESFLNLLKNSSYNAVFPYLKNRTTTGVLDGLFIHAFFYSQYRQILLEIIKWAESNDSSTLETSSVINAIYKILDAIRPQFLNLYGQCLEMHPHPKIFYERGMLLFHQGSVLDSLRDIASFINHIPESQKDNLLTSELYFQEGIAYAESNQYDKSVESLTKAIHKDPQNKEAYFERACAYFELGNFELSLEDYLSSGIKPQPISVESTDLLSLSFGITKGVISGAAQAGVEFIPSLLSSLQGIGHGLWAFAQEPITVSTEFIQSLKACIEFIKEHTTNEILSLLIPEIKELIQDGAAIENEKKGELIGGIIGKYGIDIFASIGLTKGIKFYRDLKRANHLLTLEAMSLSEKNRSLIQLEALKKAQARKEILKQANLKIQWDKQGKHLPHHRNFDSARNRSILEHPDPQKLVNDYAGKGMKVSNKKPGMEGYKEFINFNEFIGYSVDPNTGKKIATTWGKIHYAKNGVHIVPTEPRY